MLSRKNRKNSKQDGTIVCFNVTYLFYYFKKFAACSWKLFEYSDFKRDVILSVRLFFFYELDKTVSKTVRDVVRSFRLFNFKPILESELLKSTQ